MKPTEKQIQSIRNALDIQDISGDEILEVDREAIHTFVDFPRCYQVDSYGYTVFFTNDSNSYKKLAYYLGAENEVEIVHFSRADRLLIVEMFREVPVKENEDAK